jgi:Rap1a immunity proteins
MLTQQGRHVPQVIGFMLGETRGALRAGFCLGFLGGMLSLSRITHNTQNLPFFCAPAVTNEQGARVLVKYLKEHPEMLHLEGDFLTFQALMEAFPCR